jgi:hypothetical protein
MSMWTNDRLKFAEKMGTIKQLGRVTGYRIEAKGTGI